MKSVFSGLVSKIRHRNWPEVTAEVDCCRRMRGNPGYQAGMAQPGFYGVGFTYVVDGKSYSGDVASPVELEKLDTFPIRYDPGNPVRNSVDPYPNWAIWYDVVLVAVFVSVILYFAWKQQ